MTTLRTAAQQALEALEHHVAPPSASTWRTTAAITALRAALAQKEPVTEDMKAAVRWAPSSAYWSQRLREFFGPDAREGIDALERRLAEAQQAEPKGGGNLPPPLQAEPVATVAENATTQQFVGETPPSDYRRGYWDGFNIGKREGRIEAEDALAQQAEPVQEPVAWYSVDQPLNYMTRCADGTKFTNAVVMPAHAVSWAYTAPPQRPTEPVQEPVAWRCACGANLYIDAQGRPASKAEQPAQSQQAPLMQEIARLHDRAKDLTLDVEFLSQPPQRLPLTEEEIDKIFKHLCNTVGASYKTMTRAVERAHGIGEQP